MDPNAISEDLSVLDEVANGLRPFTCGLQRERRGSKKARTEESAAPTRLQDSSSESTPSVDNSPSSSSDSASSVGASNCDSVLEELDEWYTRLEPLGDKLHDEPCPDDPAAIKQFFEQGWDSPGTERSLHQFLSLPVAWPLAQRTSRQQQCSTALF